MNIFRNKNIGGLNRIEGGVIFVDEKKRLYDTIIKFTNCFEFNMVESFDAIFPDVDMIFKDYYLSDSVSHLLHPVLITEKEFNIWITPSVDGEVIRVAMETHVPQSIEVMKRSLNIDAYVDRRKIDVISSALFTHTSSFTYSESPRTVVPCWTSSEDDKKIVVVESVDSYYNSSPIISEEITTLLGRSIN